MLLYGHQLTERLDIIVDTNRVASSNSNKSILSFQFEIFDENEIVCPSETPLLYDTLELTSNVVCRLVNYVTCHYTS